VSVGVDDVVRAAHVSSVGVLAAGLATDDTLTLGPERENMIVDCHAHVFTHWIGACGH